MYAIILCVYLTATSFVIRHLVTRAFSDAMKLLATFISEKVREYYKDKNVDNILCLDDFNSMVCLTYFEEQEINWHCDQTYNDNGEFSSNLNSQKENTVVAVLTIGAKRKLKFRAVRRHEKKRCRKVKNREEDKKVPKGPIEIENTDFTFDLTHFSLSLLDPRDEKPEIRGEIDLESKTYYQHSPHFTPETKGDISVGLAWRVANSKVRVDKKTGRHQREDDDEDFSFHQRMLDDFMEKEKEEYEQMFQNLVENMLTKFNLKE